jgi:hypothetical protein
MSEQSEIKICPKCKAEYYAHVETCKECKVALVFPSEGADREPAGFSVPADWPAGDIACVVEGQHARIKELSMALDSRGVPHKIARIDCEDDKASAKCKPVDRFGLVVPRSLAEAAVKAMEAHWQAEHPELKLVNERMETGLCPACGTKLNGTPDECPDCGLNLAGPEGQAKPGGGSCC